MCWQRESSRRYSFWIVYDISSCSVSSGESGFFLGSSELAFLLNDHVFSSIVSPTLWVSDTAFEPIVFPKVLAFASNQLSVLCVGIDSSEYFEDS